MRMIDLIITIGTNFYKVLELQSHVNLEIFFLQWSDNLRNMINALIKKKKNITFSYILNNILHNSDHHFHGGIKFHPDILMRLLMVHVTC